MSSVTTTTVTTAQPAMKFKKSFEEEDKSIPYRIVGSYEYVIALDALEELMASTTPEEQSVLDGLLLDQPEFSFYSGVVLDLGAETDLTHATKEEKAKFDFAYQRNSLPWLMALARVELAATMSLYGSAESPFEFAAPVGVSEREYEMILADDIAAHWHALSTDPMFKEVMTKKGREITLPYLRRIKLIDDMLTAMVKSEDDSIAEESEEVQKHVKGFGKKLTKKIEKLTQEYPIDGMGLPDMVQTQTNSSGSIKSGSVTANSSIIRNCQRLFLDRANSGAYEK